MTMPNPEDLTTLKLPFTSKYIIKTGPIRDQVPRPYLFRDDGFLIGLPPDITIEEITSEFIETAQKEQEENLKKEREVGKCINCEEIIYIKLGPENSFYVQHGVKGKRQKKCEFKNLSGPIFEDDNIENLTIEDCLERFSLSSKNPKLITTLNEWSYYTAVGPYGGYAMKKRNRKIFEKNELDEMTKDEIVDLVNSENFKLLSNHLGGEILKLSISNKKDKMIEKIIEHLEIEKKFIEKLKKENLVELVLAVNKNALTRNMRITFYRGRYTMKPDKARRENLMSKILFQTINKPLESPKKALTIKPKEILELFGDIESS